MLTNSGFNLWANNYDQSVQLSEESNEYPFAGYKQLLNAIYQEVMSSQEVSVLDIGIGTGTLCTKLYENNHAITGIDFSEKMLSIAKEKMPNATLIQWDINKRLPSSLFTQTFDYIISTYTLHHLNDEEKVVFLQSLFPHLTDNGKVFIGDIAFMTNKDLELCKNHNIHHWDEDEFYFIHETFAPSLNSLFKLSYKQISSCAGLYILEKK